MKISVVGLLAAAVLVLSAVDATARPPRLARVDQVRLQTSVLVPKGWTVRFESASVAVLVGAHGTIELRMERPPKPIPMTMSFMSAEGMVLTNEIVDRMGPGAVTVRRWHCVNQTTAAGIASGLCMKVIGPPDFDTLAVSYQASGAGKAEFDSAALAAIGDGVRGFDPTRRDPRDDRTVAIKLVAQPVPGTKATVLAPEDWRVEIRPDGILLLAAPGRPDALGLSRPPTGATMAEIATAFASVEETFVIAEWRCGRTATAGMCFHLDPGKMVDARLDFELTDDAQLAWIRDALARIGGSVPPAALRVVVPSPDPAP